MEIRSDIVLKGSTWYDLQQGYVHRFFDTLWGVFLTCLSVGILYDTQIEDEDDSEDEDKVTIPRTMFNRNAKEMEFYFQSAILTSNSIHLSEKDRLYLAFSDSFSVEELSDSEKELLLKGVSDEALNFDKLAFLRKFANYGAQKLHENLTNNDSETMENLMDFLIASYNGETDELIAMTEVEDLSDDEAFSNDEGSDDE